MRSGHQRTCRGFRRPVASLLAFIALGLTANALSSPGDVKVSDRAFVRHDGGTDVTIASCNSDATTPTAGGDGGGDRQQNEPAVAINPLNTQVIAAGANDYCVLPTIGDAWLGFYVSQDGGTTWVNSLIPGYPTDTSTKGQASPSFGRATAGSDPVMDWDGQNRLFYGGVFFNRTTPNISGVNIPGNGDMTVSTFQFDPSAPLGMNYVRTVIVGEGTPSGFGTGRESDKPSLRIDDHPGSPHANNIYVAWTLFPGQRGNDQILFARSTDHGVSFSKPIKISKAVAAAQGSDIAVSPDGSVYVFWRQFAVPQLRLDNAIVFVKSTDGGATFSDPQVAQTIRPYDRRDVSVLGGGAADCGSGPAACVSHFAFHRTATFPQTVSDSDGNVFVTWEQVKPAPDNGDTYRPDGQSQAVVSKSTDGGATWGAPVAIDPQPFGHQWWPNIEFDRTTGTLVAVYFDSREDPSYSVNRPPGNTAAGLSVCGAGNCDVLNTFVATSKDGMTWSSIKVSTVGHQPEFEMFGDRQVPFHGDYLWIDANGGTVFAAWTDNRDVVPGVDIREAAIDGFDVQQCRPTPTSPDLCPNAGGLNQNIYGARVIIP